jgi:UDP-GlcNAc:undecaprenyl-phosphate GlcNAc-1-phosphate transferase
VTLVALVILAALAALFTALATPLVRRAAIRWKAVDLPDERRVHGTPTPRLGGLAVFAAFMAAVAAAALAGALPAGGDHPSVPAFLAAATLIVALGAADDLRRLRPGVKLAVEIAAAALVVYGGGARVTGLSGLGGVIQLGALSGPLTILWIVLVTNALNLVDGIDGLASGAATISFAAVAVIAHGFGFVEVTILAVILAGACAGFLVHNFHPATIFLGDSGSLFLGFALGVLSTYARAKGATGAITLATLLVVALPVGDALLAVQRRYLKGLRPASPRSHLEGLRRVFEADRNHLHHRLLRAGLGQRAAVYALYAIQVAACAYAVYLVVSR